MPILPRQYARSYPILTVPATFFGFLLQCLHVLGNALTCLDPGHFAVVDIAFAPAAKRRAIIAKRVFEVTSDDLFLHLGRYPTFRMIIDFWNVCKAPRVTLRGRQGDMILLLPVGASAGMKKLMKGINEPPHFFVTERALHLTASSAGYMANR